MSASVNRLRQGWFHDPEDSRETLRLRAALAILAIFGAVPEWTHGPGTYVEFGREKHCCDYRCTVAWPEWVTDDVLASAYSAADTLQTARGAFNRRAAFAARRALA